MRHFKLMIVAVAAIVLPALGGVSTASATRLCAVSTSPCPSGSIYTFNVAFPTHLKPGVQSTITTFGSPVGTNPTVTCNTSTFGITSADQGGGAGVPATARLASLSLTGCSSATPSGCETQGTVGTLTNAFGKFAWTSGFNGTLTFTLPTVSFNCPILGANVICTFGGSGTVDARVTGGLPAILDITNQNLATTGGFGCPTASTWNTQYAITVPLYITNS